MPTDSEREKQLHEVVARFRTGGRVVSVEPWGSGHIHDTFVSRVETAGGVTRFLHQRINRAVFPSPGALMENIARIIAHVRGKIIAGGGDPSRRTLTLVPADDGRPFYRSPEGDCWRTYHFIEGARAHDTAQDPGHTHAVGRAFALFQQMIADLPDPRLHETIPHFGDTRRRFETFLAAVEADPQRRVARARDEIRYARDREKLTPVLEDLVAGGTVPERIIHFDTKIDNVLIDERTGEGICVIDLDTVMPGTALYDFGDMVRLGATREAEDQQDLDRVRLDLDLFDGLARGYLEVARDFLVPAEVERLVEAARLVTFTLGVRFLTDYLLGDRYFRTMRKHHNLDRCRAQFALLADLEARAGAMEEIVLRS